jgi:hypothetical protein
MIIVDVRAHSEHVQIIRCGIKPGSVEKSRDVENETISFFKGVFPEEPF